MAFAIVVPMNAPCQDAPERGADPVGLPGSGLAAARIDGTRRFICEEFTPLFYTSEYGALTDAVRLRYNQLHALYFNEQVTFFEQEMLSPALLALSRRSLPPKLAKGLRTFFEEEQRHTASFRELNRRGAPEFYAAQPYYFIRITRPMRALLGVVASRPSQFPLLVWLALLQEERSLHYSTGCLERAADLEPHFVAIHRAHLADEVGHVGWDEELLDWLWPQVGPVVRSVNVHLLDWMLGEFFLLPKRSGLRVVRQLVREFPHLEAKALHGAMKELGNNPSYVKTLYSRDITPRSFARFDKLPGFALLAQTLPGYRPRDSA